MTDGLRAKLAKLVSRIRNHEHIDDLYALEDLLELVPDINAEAIADAESRVAMAEAAMETSDEENERLLEKLKSLGASLRELVERSTW